ncbi:MAG: hypothetical protein WKG52_11815 [Variovorax sp.]
MPSTIPYDPSLALGAIVDPAAFTTLTQISELNAEIDAAQDNLNAFISMKRSIDMTMYELVDMEVDPSAIKAKSDEIKKEVSAAAASYAELRIDNEAKIRPLKAKVHGVHQALESPVDYDKSKVLRLDIAADSLKMDSQYFSFEQNDQGVANSMSGIKALIAGAASHLGADAATEVATAGVSQIAKQRKEHQIVGTLVVTAACTHRKAAMLQPLVIDVDKAVSIWNHAFPSDRLRAADPAGMIAAAAAEGDANKQTLQLLTGASYGSSFVGMVHMLQNEATDAGESAGSNQSLTEVAESMQEKFKVAAWLEGESGGFGADAGFVQDIKRLLSKQEFSTHVTLITMGVVPSIKSNELAAGVDKFAKLDAKEMMEGLAGLAPSHGFGSVGQAADDAKNAKKFTSMKGAQTSSLMVGLDEIDEKKNSVVGLNSLVTAFDNYIEQVSKGSCSGVPITYFVKPLSKADLAAMWLAKYPPDTAKEQPREA